MKYKLVLIILFSLLVNSCSKQNDIASKNIKEMSKRDNIFLTEEYDYKTRREDNLLSSLEFYQKALDFYNKENYNDAIIEIELALNRYLSLSYYYLYGLCLMDSQDYENAEKAFFKAIQIDNYYYDTYRIGVQKIGRWPPTKLIESYTFDENDVPREKYFSFYNLACIYSAKMELEKSLNFLIMAIELGYPYINHLLNDKDLSALLSSSDDIKSKINSIYLKGFNDIFIGKAYKHESLNDTYLYYFEDNNSVKELLLISDDRQHTLYGTYQVKNYQLLIHFDKETGFKGVGEGKSAGVRTHYDYYDDGYSNDINAKERISIIEIMSDDRWNETYKEDNPWSF
jgi:tetratricopeptide (TPR) repeat protein